MSWLSEWAKRRERRARAARRGRKARTAALRRRPPAPPEIPWQAVFDRHARPAEATAERLLASAGNDMERLFYGPRDRFVVKWHHYLAIYDRHLARFRGTPVRLLEIGVYQGGSLQLWRDYFGKDAVIHGLDLDPRCARVDDPGLTVHIGHQADAGLLSAIHGAMGGIDVVIDDGGHIAADQVATFNALYPKLADGGVYVVEDLHTSYRPEFGGRLRGKRSFVEFLKGRIDGLHAGYLDAAEAHAVGRLDDLRSIAFYDSVAVLEKGRAPSAFWVEAGTRRVSAAGTKPGED